MTAHRVCGRDPATGQGLDVTIADGRIAAIEPGGDGEGGYISAGLVDLQVNGYCGLDLNDGALTADRVCALTRLMFEGGVTTWLPTLITAAKDKLLQALCAIADARKTWPWVRHAIPCVHVEGPFIASEDGARGAHPAEHVRPPDLAEVAEWQRAGEGCVGMVTLSPHWAGVCAVIRALNTQGLSVALGHTAATPEQITAAAEAGACLSTHLGNGVAAVLPRHPNVIWAQLAEDRLAASFIADGFHLPAEVLKAMLRAKGLDRAVLVSDLAALGGMPPGLYDQAIGGRVEVSGEGRLGVAGTPYLAGAGLRLATTIARAMGMAGLSLDQGLRLATVNPGRFVGGRGTLAVGQAADLTLFDWQEGADHLAIRQTFATGTEVYCR